MAVRKEKPTRPKPNRLGLFVRRNYIYLIVLAVIIIGVVATLKLYNNDEDAEEVSYDESSKFAAADAYYLSMYTPRSFNVLQSSDEDVVYLNQVLYSYLFRLDDNLNVVNDLADEIRINNEAGTVDITIRGDAYYRNGLPLSAYDVKFTVDMIKEIGSSSPYFRYVNKIAKIDVHDSSTLKVVFASPGTSALDNLVFPIVPQLEYDKYADFIPGSGQYVYGEYSEGRVLRLVPNPNYYGTKADLPVKVSLVGDKTSVPGLVTMDAITAYMSKDQNADTIARDKSLSFKPVVSGELEYLGFNCRKEFLNNSEIRQAIAFAIDRESIVSDDYGYSAVVSDSLYYPGFLGADKEAGINYEPKTSTTLLQQNGYSDIDEDGVVENPSGDDIILKLIVNSNNNSRVDAAGSIASNLASIGLKVEVVELTQSEMKAALMAGDFDLFLAGLSIDKQFDLRELYTSLNYGKYSGEKVVELTEALERIDYPKNISEAFSQLKTELYKEMPYFGICYKTYYFISVETLTTNSEPQFFNPYRDLGEWIWMKRIPAYLEDEEETAE